MSYELDKKRLLYNQSEDLYFITYNILLILYHLGSYSIKSEFNDYRKLAFLISIISNNKTTMLAGDYYGMLNEPNENIKENLNKLYFKSIENIVLIRYVLIILEEKGVVEINSNNDKTNIFLVDYQKYKDFCTSEKFNEEIKNINTLKLRMSKLRTIKYITFIEKMFKQNGVAVWEV